MEGAHDITSCRWDVEWGAERGCGRSTVRRQQWAADDCARLSRLPKRRCFRSTAVKMLDQNIIAKVNSYKSSHLPSRGFSEDKNQSVGDPRPLQYGDAADRRHDRRLQGIARDLYLEGRQATAGQDLGSGAPPDEVATLKLSVRSQWLKGHDLCPRLY